MRSCLQAWNEKLFRVPQSFPPSFCSQFGCFYTKTPSPRAALLSVTAGAITRIILEFTLPKDGSFVMPYNYEEYYDYGTAASANLPTFVDPGDGSIPQWNPAVEACEQEQFKDFSGVDSLTAFLTSILVFVSVQALEHSRGGKPLFTFAGLTPYEKGTEKQYIDKTEKTAAGSEENVQADKVVEAANERSSENEGEQEEGEQELAC